MPRAGQAPGVLMAKKCSMLGEFLRNPLATATIAPSSRQLTAAMVQGLSLDRARRVVEYGPGTGVFTRAAIASAGAERLRSGECELHAFEINPRLAGMLGGLMPDVRIHAESAERVADRLGPASVDAVISGLGWPSLPDAVRDGILEATAHVLRPGCEFRTFGYHIGLAFPGAWAFRRLCRKLFSQVTISPVIWRNLPPAFVYRCVR